MITEYQIENYQEILKPLQRKSELWQREQQNALRRAVDTAWIKVSET